jgi:hypothetical protein
VAEAAWPSTPRTSVPAAGLGRGPRQLLTAMPVAAAISWQLSGGSANSRHRRSWERAGRVEKATRSSAVPSARIVLVSGWARRSSSRLSVQVRVVGRHLPLVPPDDCQAFPARRLGAPGGHPLGLVEA